MRKIFLILILVLGLQAEVNECVSDICFANEAGVVFHDDSFLENDT